MRAPRHQDSLQDMARQFPILGKLVMGAAICALRDDSLLVSGGVEVSAPISLVIRFFMGKHTVLSCQS